MKALKFFAVSLFILASGAAFAQTRPVAKSVSAEALKDKQIKLSWEFPAKTEPKISSVQIFRRMRPYAQTEDLEGDLPVAELPVTEKSHIDALTEPGSWFYAVVAVTKNGPYKIIIPGMNATVKGVRPKAAPAPEEPASAKSEGKAQDDSALTESQKELLYADSKMRKAPLPYPGTLLGFDKGKTKMSGRAKQYAAELGNKKERKAVPFKSPYFFEEDMFSPDGGDEYILFETLRAGLAPKKYAKSVELLEDFLSVRRGKETNDRAIFYLGQSHYFCGDYESAVRCFLSVQDAFPELSKQWIDSSLDLLVID